MPAKVVIVGMDGSTTMWDESRRPQELHGPTNESESAARKRIKPLRVLPGSKSSWSPDGKQLVLTANSPETGLSLVDVASGERSQVSAMGKDPAFRPTGDLIAYVRNDGAAEEIWLVAPDGGGERKAADGGFPSWSSDGKTLYFHSRQDWHVKALRLDSPQPNISNLLQVKQSWYPAVSPDGRKVAFVATGRLEVVELDGGKTITQPLPAAKGGLVGWSPDSRQVAYAGYGGSDNVGLWLLDLDAGQSRQLLAGPFTMPAWSPDNTHFSFDSRPRASQQDVWIVETGALNGASEAEPRAE